jgi:hypothetical protein
MLLSALVPSIIIIAQPATIQPVSGCISRLHVISMVFYSECTIADSSTALFDKCNIDTQDEAYLCFFLFSFWSTL